MKTCIKCNTAKPESEYHKDKTKKDGLVSACRSCKNKYRSAYYLRNMERLKEYGRKHYKKVAQENPEKIREQAKICARRYRAKNIDSVRERNAKWMLENYHSRYKKDADYTASLAARRTLHNALRNLGVKKDSSSWELLGYTDEKFKQHIDKLMLKGMSWENFGDWHIDHIKPVSAFIKEGETDPKVINALDNLQPLWARDNLSKGAKYEP